MKCPYPVGFAERGCTPHPARFLGPLAPNPRKRRGFGASPQAGVGGSPQGTANQRRTRVNRRGTP